MKKFTLHKYLFVVALVTLFLGFIYAADLPHKFAMIRSYHETEPWIPLVRRLSDQCFEDSVDFSDKKGLSSILDSHEFKKLNASKIVPPESAEDGIWFQFSQFHIVGVDFRVLIHELQR